MTTNGKDPEEPTGSSRVTEGLAELTQGQHQAFERWVEPEIEAMLRVARSLTDSWADAEDVVQDTLIRAFRAMDTFDGRHPRAWLFTILRRAHLNSVRRRRPLAIEDDELARRRPAFGATESPSPEELVDDRHFTEDVERGLHALDARFRIVVLLIDVERLSYAEASGVLDIPVGTVMSRLSRGRSKLRAQLAHRDPQRKENPS